MYMRREEQTLKGTEIRGKMLKSASEYSYLETVFIKNGKINKDIQNIVKKRHVY